MLLTSFLFAIRHLFSFAAMITPLPFSFLLRRHYRLILFSPLRALLAAYFIFHLFRHWYWLLPFIDYHFRHADIFISFILTFYFRYFHYWLDFYFIMPLIISYAVIAYYITLFWFLLLFLSIFLLLILSLSIHATAFDADFPLPFIFYVVFMRIIFWAITPIRCRCRHCRFHAFAIAAIAGFACRCRCRFMPPYILLPDVCRHYFYFAAALFSVATPCCAASAAFSHAAMRCMAFISPLRFARHCLPHFISALAAGCWLPPSYALHAYTLRFRH